MSETVVDDLEAIEIDEHHCNHPPRRPSCASERATQAVEKEDSVGKPGQGVVVCLVCQPLLGLLAFADVRHLVHKMISLAIDVGDCRRHHERPDRLAVGAAKAFL
jgi:hypothetical protein